MLRKFYFALFLFISVANSCTKNDNSLIGNHSANFQAVGASAKDILSAQNFSSIKIEIQYMQGFPPDLNSINNLVNFISTYSYKTGGITITQKQIAASGKDTLNIQQIADIEKTNRSSFNSGSELAIYLLYVDANYNVQNVVGTAFRNTSVAIYGTTIAKNSGGIGQISRTKLETIALEHEFGHLMGLVNLGTPMVAAHQDVAHGPHCTITSCLMYYETELGPVAGVMGAIPQLDANCVADLKANGGK
ncbi:hypothetical protein BH09BAC2_BH09BAC2_17490 [soil metagenome]